MRRSGTLLGLYLLALLASHLHQAARPPAPAADRSSPGPGRTWLELPVMDDAGPLQALPAAAMLVSALSWSPPAGAEREGLLPVLLLHGSPGSARNFEDLGLRLAAAGRRAWALDLPGFGRSTREVPSYSIRAHAHAALAALDALGLERVHVVTWSMGGGVGLHMVDLAPERVASLAQIAAIGVQEAEGSGSYHFEHFKYALLFVGLEVLPELLPHFGLLGPRGWARGFVRNFWDTDQRPLRGIMRRSRTPTLILQGRDDFLVPAWTAEESHELILPSRLVMLPGTHFLLFEEPHGQLGLTLAHLLPFLARHDLAGRPVERAHLDLAAAPRGLGRAALAPYALMRAVPWWLLGLGLAALAAVAPRAGPLASGLGVAGLQLDLGLALVASASGGFLARRRTEPPRPGGGRWRRALFASAWTLAGALVGLALAAALGPPLPQWLAPLVPLAAWGRARSARRAGRGPGSGVV